jgi:HK97 family phage prohead protease
MTMPLYEDVAPIRIRGYTGVFNSVYTFDGGSKLERVVPGAFALGGRSVRMAYGHDDRRFASTADGSLQLWQDAHGLAFEAVVAASSAVARGLVAGVRRGEFRGASVCFSARDVRRVIDRGREVEVVVRGEISEVSLTGEPADPETAVWIADEDPDELPPHVALAQARWTVGRQQDRLAAARASARASARARKPKMPPSVVAAFAQIDELIPPSL